MVFIGEASKLSGVSVKAIRHYEEIGLLPNLVRSGSYRTFSENDIALIKLIKEARNLGFKLSEFKKASLNNDSNSWEEILKLLKQKELQIVEEIGTLKVKQAQLKQYSTLITECLAQDPDCPQTPADFIS